MGIYNDNNSVVCTDLLFRFASPLITVIIISVSRLFDPRTDVGQDIFAEAYFSPLPFVQKMHFVTQGNSRFSPPVVLPKITFSWLWLGGKGRSFRTNGCFDFFYPPCDCKMVSYCIQ